MAVDAGTTRLVGDEAPASAERARRLGRRHQLLRRSTAAAHLQLDRYLSNSRTFRDPSAFGLYIQGMRAFYAGFERWSQTIDQAFVRHWGIDRHAGWIRADLEALAHPAVSRGTSRACSANFGPASREALYGASYVLLGSSLGARMLHRVTVRAAIPDAGGSSYLERMAATVDWDAYLAFLEAADVDDEPAMLAGACAAFTEVSNRLLDAEVG